MSFEEVEKCSLQNSFLNQSPHVDWKSAQYIVQWLNDNIRSHQWNSAFFFANLFNLCHIEYILREKSLAIYFEDSQFRRNRTFNFIVSKIYHYVDKPS